ncbi:MAG: CHAP domain-containing protein, partial [Nitrospinota bacterium]
MRVKGNSLFEKLGIGLLGIFLLFVFGCEKEKSVTGPTASNTSESSINNAAINAAGTSSCGESYGNPYPCCKNGGNCTWWAWKMAKENWRVSLPIWGDAYQWLNNAESSGYQTTPTPEVNSIAVNTTAMATINGKRQKARHVA